MSETNVRKYESVIIIRPTLDDESVDKAITVVEEHLKSLGGNVLSSEKRGRKRLAYEVKKMRDGFFFLLRYELNPQAIVTFRRHLGLNEDVIRSITVALEEEAAAAIA